MRTSAYLVPWPRFLNTISNQRNQCSLVKWLITGVGVGMGHREHELTCSTRNKDMLEIKWWFIQGMSCQREKSS